VRNQYGRPIGRIEDLRVEPDGEDYLVTEFLMGPLELLPRLRAFVGELPILRTLGIGQEARLRRIPWRWIDLSNPEQPRLVGKSSPRAGRGLGKKEADDEDESGRRLLDGGGGGSCER
jgi:hypothetical protein